MNSNEMLSVPDLVARMKSKGIKFSIEDDTTAISHLSKHNNYFKLTAYRKNYSKITSGPNAGKYEKLEFAFLVELARIDTEVRHLILQMTLDVEHFFKVALINAVESNLPTKKDDGYKIVSGYLNADDVVNTALDPDAKTNESNRRNASFNDMVTNSQKNPYCKDLISKFISRDMPIWVFIELCSFGSLIKIGRYYQDIRMWKSPIDMRSLDRVRQLRNACAHGNCIINDLNKGNEEPSYPVFISHFLNRARISVDQRKKKMSNPRISQIVNLLYIYDSLISKGSTRTLRLNQLHKLIDERMTKNAEYFKDNLLLSSTYKFFKSISDSLL